MNWDWVGGLRLGGGLIGKTSYTIVMMCLVCLVAVVALPDLWKLVPLGLAGLVVGIHLFQSFAFAKLYPILAVMDGVEAVTYLQTQVAASDPLTIEASTKPSANTAAPPSLASGGTYQK